MNDNAKLLIKTLRSGQYRQTKGCLRDGNGYCCLGVATDLFHKQTGRGEWKDEGDTFAFYVDGRREGGVLPEPVQKWFGFKSSTGAVVDPVAGTAPALHLPSKNDIGVPFPRIADLIESEPEGLFT